MSSGELKLANNAATKIEARGEVSMAAEVKR